MPFILSELERSDCAAFAAVDDAATKGWPLAMAMDHEASQEGKTRQQWVQGWFEKLFDEPQQNIAVLKLTDEETGEIAAGAMWRWQLQETRPKEDEMKDGKADLKEITKIERPPGIMAAMGKGWADFQKNFFPKQPYYNLQVLFTHPKYQRKGAGSILVQYGCDKADEAGLITVLNASEMGRGLYLKHGFEIVQEYDWDLRPFGVDASEKRRSMIRQPGGTCKQ